jgi:hypothetical protein
MKTIYISGPMTGYENFNREAFMEAEKKLVSEYIVINPAKNKIEDGEWIDYMRMDIRQLMDADCIYMLKGWVKSKGARLEKHIAVELGLEMNYQDFGGE